MIFFQIKFLIIIFVVGQFYFFNFIIIIVQFMLIFAKLI